MVTDSRTLPVAPAWNAGTVWYPRDRCLHELFDARAALRPRATASVQHGRSMSYGELKDRSDALAARLLGSGVRRGDGVGVCGGRSLEALVAFLGILKAGAAYVPLDDASPPGRLQAMAEDAGVHTVVTLPGSVCRIRRVRTRIALNGSAPSAPVALPRTGARSGDCAYVMFTSGSTGRPKPVAVPHCGVVRLAASDLVWQRPRPGERVLHAYGLSSDASTIEIWSALLAGACVVIADQEELLSPAALESRLLSERVSVAYLTTGVFHHIGRTRPSALRSLRFASAGGEAMDPELARAILAACPDTTVVNFYGPTENSVVSTAHLVDGLPPEATAVPIGRPLENSTCYVVRADGTLADAGEEGELLVGGDGLALGYLGDPELTAERFVDNRFEPGTRLYRTGDRVVRRADGVLEYRARVDRQIKLRGHRIEPDEIEARLRADDTVGEAVVELEGDSLIGYVTPARPGMALPLDRIRGGLTAWLPAAAVPARLVEVGRFPVTAGGKVDRRRLRLQAAPDTAPRSAAGTAPYKAPETTAPGATATGTGMGAGTGTETATAPAGPGHGPGPAPVSDPGPQETVARVWQVVLGVRPAPGDGFFDIGGDSLLAAEVVTRTLAAFGLDARYGRTLVHSLLRSPTLEDFTAAVATLTSVEGRRARAAPEAHAVDFRAESRLGFALPSPRGPEPDWRHPGEVLLTGASGFVGAFLLDRLLRRTGARVHCPVRARDAAHARRKVMRNLARFGLAGAEAADRVVCFPADLAEPGLGMEPGRAEELAGTLDLVLHAAAQVNFLYPYEALRRANVEGTRQLVGLAAERAVPVHFFSTIAVLAGFGTAGVRHVDEDLPLDHADRLTMGYAESKWVAEEVLRDAAGQGLPVAVHRPYEITGDRRTGACNTDTAICSLFKTITETGLAPDIPLPLDFVPVDFLTEAVVHIATGHRTTHRTYHMTNPRPASLRDMLDRMDASGHRIRRLPYEEWVDDLVRHVARHPTSPTAPFVSLCVDRCKQADMSVKEMYFEGTFPSVGRDNIERDLAGTGLSCPPVDADLLDRYLEYFYATGYIERP
ncbi:amino acid adenylation domain-containing SDR family oxidoreductase [Streptomyces sp. CB01373]|uniref:amino acid adenylation domain-containing SDR family oxidoreductase n=1 Tax=Streptomyces sp. CB01373 TaxID=2020325 RepID=UPI000C275B41|nr:amino acid adenylation domain-containing SDR family oxidoreductase [Streptomyces sp. CB01373]PJM93306.1 thioester reductase [Streptomyces sp. CB01373]